MSDVTFNARLTPAFRFLDIDDRNAFMGVEEFHGAARIAEMRVLGHPAVLVIDDNGFEIHTTLGNGAPASWAFRPGEDAALSRPQRAALECLANRLVADGNGSELGLTLSGIDWYGLERGA
jgi:hypothetical protein